MEAKKSKLPYLPDDLTAEILLRTPVKSVGRFRCLSKLFCSLLSVPKFARNQLELTLRRRSDNRRLIMSSQKLFLVNLDSVDVEHEYLFKEDLIILSKLTDQNPKFKKRMSYLSDQGIYKGLLIDIMGTSNGLICLRYAHIFRDEEDEVLLYNPTTRDSKIIPELPKSLHCKPYHQWFCRYGYGFGFDALTNDYKVVKLVPCRDGKDQSTVCYVYSLKTDSWWRKINNLLPCYNEVYVSTENLKGAIHWIARIEDQKQLMAFDLEKEELREIPLPNYWAEEFDHDLSYYAVGTFKGCLCVVHGCFKMHNIMWVMKEYGLESSWSKIKISVSEYLIKPTLCLSKNDEEVLLMFDGHFLYTKFKIDDGEEEVYIKMNTSRHVESLISPNSYGEQR